MKHLRFQKLWLLITLLFAPVVAHAYDFLANGIYYTITDAVNMEVEVAEPPSTSLKYEGSIIIPSNVTNSDTGVTYTVTAIGKEAFYCGVSSSGHYITYLSLPNTLKEIKDNAFRYVNFNSSVSVSIPSSVTTIGDGAFYSTNITKITFKEGLQKIGQVAFYGTDISSISIPKSVTSIGYNAFATCSDLRTISVHSDNEHYISVNNALYNKSMTTLYVVAGASESYEFPETVVACDGMTFAGCDNLKKLIVPNTITRSPSWGMFLGSGIEEIKLSENWTRIVEHMFASCENLKTLDIPYHITSIGGGAFTSSGIEYLVVPNHVTGIDNYAFQVCKRLKYISIPAGVYVGKKLLTGTDSLMSAKILGTPSSIDVGAFTGMSENSTIYHNGSSSILTALENTDAKGVKVYIIDETVDNSIYSTSSLNGKTNPLLVRTLKGNQWNTLCVPFDLTEGQIKSAFGEDVKVAEYKDSVINGVMLIEPVNEIKAGTPYFIKPANTVYHPVFENLTTVAVAPQTVGTDYKLVGTYGRQLLSQEKKNLLVDDLGVVASTADSTYIDGIRAYVEVSNDVDTSSVMLAETENIVNVGGLIYLLEDSVAMLIAKDETVSGEIDVLKTISHNGVEYTVQHIKNNAFSYSGITSVTLPSSVVSVDGKAFENCPDLKSITCFASLPPVVKSETFTALHEGIKLNVPSKSTDAYKANSAWGVFDVLSVNALYIDDVLLVGKTPIIPILMDNEQDINNLQFDIKLPSGMSIAYDEEEEEYLVTKGERAKTAHSVATNKRSDGSFRVIISSAANATFSNSDKSLPICNIKLKITSDVAPGKHKVKMYNVTLASHNSSTGVTTSIACSDTTATFTVPESCMINVSANYDDRGAVSVVGEEYDAETRFAEYGSSVTLTAKAAEEYRFVHWEEDSTILSTNNTLVLENLISNRTIKAEFRPAAYLITFLVDGDTVFSSKQAFGTVIQVPESPKKQGYTFYKWMETGTYAYMSASTTVPERDVTYKATFSTNRYNVTFVANNDTIYNKKMYYKSTITAPDAPDVEGYTFVRWDSIHATVPAYDVRYTAVYQKNKYLITFVADGEILSKDSLYYGDEITVPEAPAKQGYIFAGWSPNDNIVPAKDVEFNAVYVLIGDVLGSGALDVGDLTKLVAIIKTGTDGLDETTFTAADVNNDGKIDIIDYTKLVGIILNADPEMMAKAMKLFFDEEEF